MFENEESSSEDVDSLRDLLTLTEISLQSVGQQLSQSGHDDECVQPSLDHLTLQYLQTPDGPLYQPGCVCQERRLSGTVERRAAGSLSPSSTNSRSASVKARSLEMESVAARRKLGCVRQENACLTMQDEELISDLDAMQYELVTSKSQVCHRGPRVGVKNNAAVMSEQIRRLEAELEANAKELKAAKLRIECCQEAAAHSDIVAAAVTDELRTVREELDNLITLCKRAEQQRNQALQNAEKLKDAFKEYKATISIKLQRVMESESKLKESLIECDREKEELEMKCTLLERENVEHIQTISKLKEEMKQAKSSAAERSALQAQLEEAGRRASYLEQQLVERAAECRETTSVRRELEDLRTLTQSQEQRVAQSHIEAQQSQAELASLEATLALLHLREGAVGSLCVRPCTLPTFDYSGTTHLLKLKPGEGYQQLLRVLQSVDTERAKQSNLVERLQERLSRAQEEISSLQGSMAQRASHYQSLHTELLDKVSQATDTEKELKRKSARASALEKQLQEKTSAYSLAALKNTELENQLAENTSTLQHYQSLMTKKQREYQQSLEKCKKSQAQQCTEQQHRIEMLQLSVEEAQSRVLEIEQELTSLQKERDEAQRAALLLQSSVEQLTQERQVEMRDNDELLQSFKEQALDSASKVCELQSSLSACREELNLYQQQMEEVKKIYETELQWNNDKVQHFTPLTACKRVHLHFFLFCLCKVNFSSRSSPLLLPLQVSSLQEKLHTASLDCQTSSEQNLQLQLSLQQQQTMLTESTARIAELEESQSQLQRQVSSLEQQLERIRTSLQDEVRNRERDSQEKDKDLQEVNQQNTQLSETVSHLTSEMTKCRGELVSKESELQRLRWDVTAKTSQISRMEESLQQTKSLLDSKSEMVADLDEKLHRSEADRLNCAQRVKVLEGQLQAVRGELADTLEQLRELRDVLQRTQTISDERQTAVENLTVALSETRRELEERTHEVLDMDSALKERQGELQQRANLLGQLDVAIKEHKQEMERKVESLQQNLEARESKLRDTQRELTDRKTKESQELSQQLRVCQQKLQTLLQELEETQRHCDALTRELDATKLQTKEKDIRLCRVEEELALKEARWLQSEAGLQSMVTSLEQELELEREQHSKELESLQQTRGQLLKVSEQISSSMRSSQEQLTAKLQQSQTQLEQAKAQYDQTKSQLEQTKADLKHTRTKASHLQAQLDQSQTQLLQSKTQLEQSRTLYEQAKAQNNHLHVQLEQLSAQLNQARVQTARLQAQLHTSKKSIETSNESLLIKESEVTRLQARISSLERAADRQNLTPHDHALSLPALNKLTHSPDHSCFVQSRPSLPKRLQTIVHSPSLARSTFRQTCSSPPAHTDPHLSDQTESHQTCNWMQSSSIDSSLDLPLSLKATLREALHHQPWETSSPSLISSLPDTAGCSWQGLSSTDVTVTSDLSFNPLTYMVDRQEDRNLDRDATLMQERDDEQMSESRRESVCILVGQEEEGMDMSSLTGMLRFVNQTLAMQEDLSSWSSAGLSQSGHRVSLQSDVKET
ncbi:coiled-coil domain-containing protein 18 isoform X1 [Scomber scombrus]|uniref:coiled-coil domain-containing protein 18 isoform X1 n=1 Tax=Scomber scombrus TaxID=13677 RepID=UPI002DDB5276|nr:coiled-coil domain-containing protein 18 isoform X1 [Scomber scombrus]